MVRIDYPPGHLIATVKVEPDGLPGQVFGANSISVLSEFTQISKIPSPQWRFIKHPTPEHGPKPLVGAKGVPVRFTGNRGKFKRQYAITAEVIVNRRHFKATGFWSRETAQRTVAKAACRYFKDCHVHYFMSERFRHASLLQTLAQMSRMPLPQYITRTLCDKELLRVNNNGQGPFLVEVCLRRYAEDGNDIWAKSSRTYDTKRAAKEDACRAAFKKAFPLVKHKLPPADNETYYVEVRQPREQRTSSPVRSTEYRNGIRYDPDASLRASAAVPPSAESVVPPGPAQNINLATPAPAPAPAITDLPAASAPDDQGPIFAPPPRFVPSAAFRPRPAQRHQGHHPPPLRRAPVLPPCLPRLPTLNEGFPPRLLDTPRQFQSPLPFRPSRSPSSYGNDAGSSAQPAQRPQQQVRYVLQPVYYDNPTDNFQEHEHQPVPILHGGHVPHGRPVLPMPHGGPAFFAAPMGGYPAIYPGMQPALQLPQGVPFVMATGHKRPRYEEEDPGDGPSSRRPRLY